jgi:hypothetical protein
MRFVLRSMIGTLLFVACSSPTAPAPARAPRHVEEARAPSAPVAPLPPSTLPAPARLVAIGDVHGDLDPFLNVLRLAGAIDGSDHWVGGALVVVQTGDLLDRGDDEEEILALVLRLEQEASAAGGRFVALNGNHEIMNVQGDFRYVTRGGFEDFASFGAHGEQGRTVAFAPGGRYARELAARNTVVVVGDTVFVHGGLVARRLGNGIDGINQAVRRFFLDEAPLTRDLEAEDSPVWDRRYALEDDDAVCARLDEALALVPAHRMVVGHTVQPNGISSACDARVWRIDVGLAALYDGPIEALEIAGDEVRVLHGTR